MTSARHPTGQGEGQDVFDQLRQPILGRAIAAIALLTLWRVGMLWFGQIDLWVDEAQYWLWGQSFSFGSYSKPPLIGWLIGLSTGIVGDSVFGVRLAAPLIHAGTALAIIALARELVDARAAALAGLVYATMPAASLGSLLISTDTPMLLAFAVALLAQQRLALRRSWRLAVLFGVAIGAGFLAKHAMLFAVAGMAAAAAVAPAWRMARRDLLIGAAVALLLMAPNLWWIASNGFVTVHHLAQSGTARGIGLHPMAALRFLAEQFAVMGPVAFAAFLLGAAGQGKVEQGKAAGGALRGLAVAAAVVLGIVLAQALGGRALANWAVGFTVPGCIVAALWLAPRPRLAALSIGIGLAVAVALPLLSVFGTNWRGPDGRLLLARYLGRAEVSGQAIAFAQANGARTIVVGDRGLLADLDWQARGTGIRVMATPHDGPPRHHWDLVKPFDPAVPGPVVVLQPGPQPVVCAPAAATPAAPSAPAAPGRAEGLPSLSWTAGPGFAEGRVFSLSLTFPDCLMDVFRD